MKDLVIIGAGPYGLSLAAHAAKAGLDVEICGYPMDFWQSKMPPQMFIRTLPDYTSFSDPENRYTLACYQEEKGMELSYPIPRRVFVDYGMWFIEKNRLSVQRELATELCLEDGGFCVHTEAGRMVRARNVAVAVGLTNAQYIPPHLRPFHGKLISHTAEHTAYDAFSGQKVIVLGGGQSAWEAAALLHEAGADVELVYRRSGRLTAEPNVNVLQRQVADQFYHFSKEEKQAIRNRIERPTVADFLVTLVEGKVPQRPNTTVEKAERAEDGKLHVYFGGASGGETAVVDHLVAATGYRFSVEKLPFLNPVLPMLDREAGGCPMVDYSFQSNVPGLFFAGPAASFNHGPTFKFVAGVSFASRQIADAVKNRLLSH